MKRTSGSNATRNRIRRRREFDSHDGGEWKVTVTAMEMVEQRQYSGHAKVEGWRVGGTGLHKGKGRRGQAKVETEGTRCAVPAG
uniref:Uncharacterized protein n=1 Tax=Oryza meridionalis TaxID=40149 RepID=A0A0E0E1P8_9ORYZ